MRLGWMSMALFASILTMLLSVWMWNEPWDQAAGLAAVWLVMGVVGGWWITSTDSLSAAALAVESTVSAELMKVDGQRITTRQGDGTELVWSVESPRKMSLAAGQRLWLGSPALRGKHVLAVVDSNPNPDREPTVLWPADVAWTPGRWD